MKGREFFFFKKCRIKTTRGCVTTESSCLPAATGVWTGLIILRVLEENLDIRLVFLQGRVQRQLEDRDRVLWIWWKHLCSAGRLVLS